MKGGGTRGGIGLGFQLGIHPEEFLLATKCFYMNTNRFEAPKHQPVKRRRPVDSDSAWLGLAVVATLVFVVAIRMLTWIA